MNPFFSSSAGLFAVVRPDTGQSVIAERITAALAAKLTSDPKTILDSSAWLSTLENVPGLIDSSQSSQTLQQDTQTSGSKSLLLKIAEVCLPAKRSRKAGTSLAPKIEAYLSGLNELAAFNSLVLDQGDEKYIQVRFCNVHLVPDSFAPTAKNAATVSMNYTTSDFTIDLVEEKTSSNLKAIFGSYEPLKNEPYYILLD